MAGHIVRLSSARNDGRSTPNGGPSRLIAGRIGTTSGGYDHHRTRRLTGNVSGHAPKQPPEVHSVARPEHDDIGVLRSSGFQDGLGGFAVPHDRCRDHAAAQTRGSRPRWRHGRDVAAWRRDHVRATSAADQRAEPRSGPAGRPLAWRPDRSLRRQHGRMMTRRLRRATRGGAGWARRVGIGNVSMPRWSAAGACPRTGRPARSRRPSGPCRLGLMLRSTP